MTAGRPLRVGYLHGGRERSGLRRYSRIIADEAASRSDLEVIEADLSGRGASLSELRRTARRLHRADVVHLQWKLADWDPRWGGIPRMEVVLQSLRRPLVVTMHDVFEREGRWERQFSPAAIGLRRLARGARRLVVHSDEERHRLAGLVPRDKLELVPHFVEIRPALRDRGAARKSLGLEGRRVVTLLGYITKRRGHRLVIDALAELPADVVALFVGSTIEGREHIRGELEEHAQRIGVAHRVRFMGYVSDAQLEEVLAATDVALCPFRRMSASGALATWISSGRPIVTSNLGPLRELDALEPGSLHVFEPYEPTPLAAAISETLALADDQRDPRVSALARRLATPRIVDRYVGIYQAALSR
ncbi:MAG: glycosyltransferase family 4 protein [Chloroflexota bacterium]